MTTANVATPPRARSMPRSATNDTALMTVAAVLLGVGVTLLNPDRATAMVVACVLAAVVGVLASRDGQPIARGSRMQRVLAGGILVEALVLTSLPALEHSGYQAAAIILALVAVHGTLVESRWRWAEVVVVLAGYFGLMCWMIAATISPPMDVILIQQDGVAALLKGVNPYSIELRNIYGQGSPYYPPELEVGDHLAFGFLYPPLSLLFAIPGYLVAGDYRYGAVAAVTLTAGLVSLIRPGRVATGAAMLILFAPATPVLLYWGWTEAFVGLLLAGVAYLAMRPGMAAAVVLGLLVASKQYLAPLLVIGYFMLAAVREHIGRWRMALVPIAVAAATFVPFALWDLRSLIHGVIVVQVLQPFRMDALTIPAVLARQGMSPSPAVLGFVLGAVALVALIRTLPRTVAGFSYALAVVFLVFFLFNKHAFVNYYYFVLVAMACGIAATQVSTGRPHASDSATRA